MDLEQQNADLLARISNVAAIGDLVVTSDADLEAAAAQLRDVKALQKDADAAQKAVTQPLEQQKKAAIAWFRDRIVSKLEGAESRLKRGILAYQQEQERIRREQQRAAEEAARKERERLERQAAKAEAAGKADKAEELAERAQTVVAPVVDTAPPKVAGVSTREVWRFEITDPAALPREYLVPDEKKIGAVVRALKGDAVIPGVRVYAEQTLAAAS